jgi:predicted secreted hydrolase
MPHFLHSPTRIHRTVVVPLAVLVLAIGVLISGPAGGRDMEYPVVQPGVPLVFPRDHGAHPVYRTEWWYITGWAQDQRGNEFGIQITFFRNRPLLQEDNPSAFAPRQLLFAHAAIADPRHGRLRHDQRAAREGLGMAHAREENTDVRIDDWSLRLEGNRYLAQIGSREFALELAFEARQPLLPQGHGGFSRKGPRPGQASYYYSRPQLAVSGTLRAGGDALKVTGTAWLDHEWSSEIMAGAAAGWDWIGINLDDGGALMAFRMRDRRGGVLWAAGTLREAGGRVRTFAPAEVSFAPLRRWRSPRSAAEYPVAMRVRAGDLQLDLEPMMDDQELDARGSTGTIYWEGAVRALRGGQRVGRGYLELTGYWNPVRL